MRKIIGVGLLMSGSFAVGAISHSLYEKKKNTHWVEKVEEIQSDPDGKPKRINEIQKYGTPTSTEKILNKSNYISSVNCRQKVPNWVLEHMNVENLKLNVERKDAFFHTDPEVPVIAQVSRKYDYNGSGYDAGHMAPAATQRQSKESLHDSFAIPTNIVPQDAKNNRFYWHKIEIFTKNLTRKFDDIYVLTGPLFLPEMYDFKKRVQSQSETPLERTNDDNDSIQSNHSATEEKYVQYKIIGESNVSVPTHLFKVILGEKDKEHFLTGFVIPNKPIEDETPLKTFEIQDFDHFERMAGFELFPAINRGKVKDLCSVVNCEIMKQKDHRLWEINRMIQNAQQESEVERALELMEKEDMKPDDYTHLMLQRKKKQFNREKPW